MNIAVVTGASSGIGKEFVKQIAEKFQTVEEIWVIARRKDRLDELTEIIEDVKIKPIVCDVSDSNDIENYTYKTKEDKITLDKLNDEIASLSSNNTGSDHFPDIC